MKILIGTKNPGKILGAKEAFEHYFEEVEVTGIPVSSDVGEQPLDLEIYEGAKKRVDHLIEFALEHQIEAEYYLGIESGITNLLGKWVIINIAVIKDKNGYESWGTSSGFPVPDQYVEEIISSDLNQVMSRLFSKADSHNGKGGIDTLTSGVVNRMDLTKEAFIMALTQYLNKEWNDKEDSITIKN